MIMDRRRKGEKEDGGRRTTQGSAGKGMETRDIEGEENKREEGEKDIPVNQDDG